MARARRLLILVTHPGDYDYWNDISQNVKIMNLAIKQNLVKKYQMN